MSFRPTSPTRPISPDNSRSKHASRFGVWQKLQHFFGRDAPLTICDSDDDSAWSKPEQVQPSSNRHTTSPRPVGVGLPRQATFKRQNSEKRERLLPVEALPYERRAYSSSRPAKAPVTKVRSLSVPPSSLPKQHSDLAIGTANVTNNSSRQSLDWSPPEDQDPDPPPADSEHPMEYDRSRPPRPPSVLSSVDSDDDDDHHYFEDRNQLNRELDTKWILNLSMHFRDKSDREKFFVTYAETPSRWRRVTVSCDYRNAEPKSLEMDLKEQQHQRDKSMQIYEAIRESLREIKFYDTVTNLKLETTDGRLHVHVTEDVNEIIPYPPITNIQHIVQDPDYRPRLIRESSLSFDSHLSGFVYKVMYEGHYYIKKEIPGPDTVDEFLYEVNALHALQDSRYVIDLYAIVTDETGQIIKGLLIDHAERGAVVDLLYDFKGELSWELRESWARHAIQGLGDIHEEGYVQGDFTLSNIVVDHNNNARIIDINRRGCPVGWEPPEIAKKIASNQRISMYIGQKSDLYQLGMSLWALAMDDDEPERHDPPLSTHIFPADVPQWYQDIVRICLSDRPRDRMSATDLIKLFPVENTVPLRAPGTRRASVRIRMEKQYINPAAAVEREDLERLGYNRQEQDEVMYSPESSREDPTFTWPQSSEYEREYDNSSSEIERPRGRRRISDHDLMLQAQREYQAAQAENHYFDEVDGPSHEPAPIITISNGGRESHIVDTDPQFEDSVLEEQQNRALQRPDLVSALDSPDLPYVPDRQLFPSRSETSENTPRLDEQHDQALQRPDLVSALGSPDLPYLTDRRLFPSHSDTTDNTPRNSSLQLFGNEVDGSRDSPVRAPIEQIPSEFAGMGSHHSTSEPNFQRSSYEVAQSVDQYPGPSPPSLSFVDSGYNEPSAFGIDFGESSDCNDRNSHISRSDDKGYHSRRRDGNEQAMSSERRESRNCLQSTGAVDSSINGRLDTPTSPGPGTTGPNAIIEVLTDPKPHFNGHNAATSQPDSTVVGTTDLDLPDETPTSRIMDQKIHLDKSNEQPEEKRELVKDETEESTSRSGLLSSDNLATKQNQAIRQAEIDTTEPITELDGDTSTDTTNPDASTSQTTP